MDTDTFEEIINNQWEQMHGLIIPNQRFFEPTDMFWIELNKLDVMMFIDCGAGDGHVAAEATERGFRMGACDIARRECHVGVEVQPMPAHRMPFNSEIWPLVCRPDHGGWVEHLFIRAMEKGSGFIYVGHSEKLEHDVGNNHYNMRADSVGQENEEMFVWLP